MLVKIKKPKAENCVVKRKLKFEDYKHYLEETQLEKKINDLEQNHLNVDSLRENHKEFIKNNKLILKLQQRFTNEKHNVFTEDVNKISLSANDDKRIQLIDSAETCPYGMSKDIVFKKEEIKCNNIIKQYKKWFTLIN